MLPDPNLNPLLLAGLQQRLLAIAEIIGNRLIALDDNLLQGLASLQGKSVAIEIIDLEKTLYCYPGASGFRFSLETPNREVDATIRARLFALINLATQPDKVSTSIQEGVSFHGEVAVAQRLQKLVADVDIDWEEVLSKQLGDVAGVQVFRALQQTRQVFEDARKSLFQSSSEYLQEEVQMTPSPIELEKFRADVTGLRHDVDRGEARINRLLSKLDASS